MNNIFLNRHKALNEVYLLWNKLSVWSVIRSLLYSIQSSCSGNLTK